MIRKILCKLGFHLRVKWIPKGLKCIDCGKFKDKSEVQADLHAGAGW